MFEADLFTSGAGGYQTATVISSVLNLEALSVQQRDVLRDLSMQKVSFGSDGENHTQASPR